MGPCPRGSCAQDTGYIWGNWRRRFGPFASPFRPYAKQSLANSKPWRKASRILLLSIIHPKFSCHPHTPRLVLSLLLWPLCSSQLTKITKNLCILNPSLLKKQAGDLVGECGMMIVHKREQGEDRPQIKACYHITLLQKSVGVLMTGAPYHVLGEIRRRSQGCCRNMCKDTSQTRHTHDGTSRQQIWPTELGLRNRNSDQWLGLPSRLVRARRKVWLNIRCIWRTNKKVP